MSPDRASRAVLTAVAVVWGALLALVMVGCCGYRLAGAPTLACAGGLPMLVPVDAGPEAP